RRLENLPGARAEVMDFLSSDFKEDEFDLIYAYGVLHHFKNVDELIKKLQEKLKMGGRIISHDPLETSIPIKVIRSIYRPFQSDSDWDWGFARRTYYKLEMAFALKDRRAVLGKAKWITFLNLLPLPGNNRIQRARTWHHEDWELSAVDDDHMFSCMHLSM